MDQLKCEKIDKLFLRFQSQMIEDEYSQFKTKNQINMFSYISYGFITLQVCVSYMDLFSHNYFLQQQLQPTRQNEVQQNNQYSLLFSVFIDILLIVIFCASLYIAQKYSKWIDYLVMVTYVCYQVQLCLFIIPHLQHKRSFWSQLIQNQNNEQLNQLFYVEREIDISFIIGTFAFLQQIMLINILKRWWLQEICILLVAFISFISFTTYLGWFNLISLAIFFFILAAYIYLLEASQMQRFFEYLIINQKVHSFYKFVDSSVPLPICIFSIQFPINNLVNQDVNQLNLSGKANKLRHDETQQSFYNSQLQEDFVPPPMNIQIKSNMQLFANQMNFSNQINGDSSQHQRKNITEVSFANKQDDLFNQASNFKLINNQTDVKQNNICSTSLQQKDTIFNQNHLSFRKEFCNQKFQKDFLNIYNNDLELILDQFMICDQNNKSLKEVLAERYQPESYNKIIQLLLKKLDDNSSLNSNTITNDQMFSQELIYDCQYNSPQSQTNVNYHTEDGVKEESLKKQNLQKMKNNNNIQEQKYRIHILETYWDDSFSVVITFQNISEKINNQELIKENQYKDQLLFTISHDLKTPLNGMQSILQAALLKDSADQIKKMIQLVQINGDLLNYLIKDILDYAQVIHKKIKPRPTYFNLQNTLQQIKQTFLYQIQEKGLKLNIVNNLNNSFLYTDEIRLKQIIFNFVSNALKFTFQGSITIKVEEVADCGEIEDELNNDPDFTQSLNIQINNNQAFYNVNNISSNNKFNIQQLNCYNDFDSINEKQTGFDEELQNQQNIQNLYSPNFPSNSNFLTNQKDSRFFQTPQLISNPIQARINSTPISQREFNKKHNVNLTKYCFTNNIEQFKKQVDNEQFQNNYQINENQNVVVDIQNKKQNHHPIFDQLNNSSIAQPHQSQLRKSNRLQKQITNQVTHSLRNSKNAQQSPSNAPDIQPEKLLQQQVLQIDNENESHKSLAIKTMNNYNIQQQDQDNEVIQITVTDTGLGMDKDLQKQLFSMFGTFEQKGVNKEGVGLGLIITQSLSQLLGPKKDNIKVKSIKDQGSSFSFKIYRRLQLVDSPKRKANAILTSNQQQNLLGQNQKFGLNLNMKNNMELNIDDNDQEITTAINQNDTQKICDFIQKLLTRPYKMLIVDDVQFNISVFKCMLHQLQNVTFDHAYNGQQAIDKLKKNNYDIVFMDINMPVMDGIQATKQIRILIQQKLVQPTIIIALTGDDIDSDSNKFSSKGFNAALSKPIKLEDLYFVLKNLKLS
ncbi:hypothetical protein ABPG74_000976 [Tetrahymena malaccensis]